jgi:uncharacterized protein
MATGSLLALIDDIATLLDDIAVLTKVAAKQSAGVLGDDLALNAHQVAGVQSARELPVIWAVAKGSLRNKMILVPFSLAISQFASWLVTPLLMLGGGYLCYEGAEKIWHHVARPQKIADAHPFKMPENPSTDTTGLERIKIQGAIRTDFILSGEIIVITLGTVATASLWTRVGVLTAIALLMTFGVYGLVAAIVKIDDLGLWFTKRRDRISKTAGAVLLRGAPLLMKLLSVAGTLAMFLVGGGILRHAVPALAGATGWLGMLADGALGAAAGMVLVVVFTWVRKLKPATSA